MVTGGSDSVADEGLDDARRFIRDEQRAAAALLGAPPLPAAGANSVAAVLALRTLWGFRDTPDPAIVHRGPFRYERATEERRLRIAENLIELADPGPFEDPTYLALLAYQAASVELAVSPGEAGNASSRWSRFLLAVIPSREVNAFATVRARSGYTVVGVHAALVDFIYQSAKAVVAAQQPVRAPDGSAQITAEGDLDRIRASLDQDDAPAHRLYRSLEAYLFDGRTRAVSREEVPEEHSPPLSLLIGLAERFVVAHEYGHGATDSANDGGDTVGSPFSAAWTAELQADNFGMFATVLSAHAMDHVPPEFALAGAIFALGCLDLLRQAVFATRDGHVPDDDGSDTHPPFDRRAHHIIHGFHKLFDLEYGEPARPPRLSVADPNRTAKPDEDLRRIVRQRATAQANILFLMWERVLPLLLRDHAAGRKLHPMWYA